MPHGSTLNRWRASKRSVITTTRQSLVAPPPDVVLYRQRSWGVKGCHHSGAFTARPNVPYRHTGSGRSALAWDAHACMRPVWSGKPPGGAGRGWPCGPHYPSAAAKQAAYRARKRQAAQDLAARECAAIQQALQTRALADQSWELYELIDACSRDPDMPRRAPAGRPPGLLAGASAHFYGMAAARVRRHRRALQRLAHVRATRGAQAGARRGAAQAAGRVLSTCQRYPAMVLKP